MEHYIMNYDMINENTFTMDEGAIAWSDLSLFYKNADRKQKNKLIEFVNKQDWEGFRKFVYQVIGEQ